jgi:hypothetical protein
MARCTAPRPERTEGAGEDCEGGSEASQLWIEPRAN